ncbi:SUKH-3 domain-containing protein [Streptomyces sp. NPDC059917]|uniref:SUKH-3 domain-containing protein n=1 Tax=Streptomyces sp. NPDC059917 TaxID=3347002 RepID=UPI00365CFD50
MPRLKTPEDVEAWFLRYGWFPGRNIGRRADDLVAEVIAEYRAEGVDLCPLEPATAFLREHGLLRLVICPRRGDSIVFEPAKTWPGDPADVRALADLLGVELFPIGYDTSEGSSVLMDGRGRFFCVHETGNYYMGADRAEAFISLGNAPMRDAEEFSA